MFIFDFTSIIGLIALVQGFLLCLYLTIVYPRFTPSWLLIAVLTTLGFALGHQVLLHSHLSLVVPHMLGFGSFSTYLIGPVIWLLAMKLVKPEQKLRLFNLLHFLPFIVQQLYRAPKIMRSSQEKLEFLTKFYSQGQQAFTPSSMSFETLTNLLLFYGHRFIYIGLACWLIYNAKPQLKHITLARKKFIQSVFWTLIIYIIAWSLIRFSYFIDPIAISVKNNTIAINALGLSGLTLFVAGFLFRYPLEAIFSEKSTQKYQKSGFDEATSQSILDDIRVIIEQQRLYCLPDIKQTDIAEKIGLSVSTISQVINQTTELNFNDFINEYRIEHVRKLLSDSANQAKDIQTLALEAGFSSKATFYRVFKEKVGMTPSMFRKNALLIF